MTVLVPNCSNIPYGLQEFKIYACLTILLSLALCKSHLPSQIWHPIHVIHVTQLTSPPLNS